MHGGSPVDAAGGSTEGPAPLEDGVPDGGEEDSVVRARHRTNPDDGLLLQQEAHEDGLR